MKKIFTLFAVAAMAFTASAQEAETTPNWWDMTEVPTAAMEVTSVPGIAVTYGGKINTNSAGEESTTPIWKDALKKKAYTIGEVKFTNYAEASDNARGANFQAKGLGARIYGGFAKYVPTQDGKLTAYFYVPDSKGVYFIEIADDAEEGTNLILGDNPSAVVYQGEGEEAIVVKFNEEGLPQGITKGVGIITCNLKKGNTYYLCLNGSKLGVGGFIYEPSDDQSGIADITVDENAPVEYYNLQGIRVANPENGLYIRRQGNKAEKIYVK